MTAVGTIPLVLGSLAGLTGIGVRYRYSTGDAAFYLAAVTLLALSPLSARLLAEGRWYLLGGVALVLVAGYVIDYLYTVITGKETGAEAFRVVAHSWISQFRDRRRRVRQRLETILDRKAIIAVLVGMPLSEFMKVTVVRLFAAEPIQWNLAWAHLTLIIVGLGIGIHWKHVKEVAHEAGEQAEEMMETEDC